ncbi:MAG: divergent PAP2 family protein [Eubacteriales bacterium]
MHSNFWIMFKHPIFLVSFTSWFLAQFFKIFTGGKIRLKNFFNAGGMPSSHSSSTMGATAACGIFLGFDSPIFIIAFVFTMIVMYDAANVRLESGKHAEIINDLVDFARTHKEFDAEQLKEIIGHEPFEVLMGALLGITIAVVYFSFLM